MIVKLNNAERDVSLHSVKPEDYRQTDREAARFMCAVYSVLIEKRLIKTVFSTPINIGGIG